MDFIEKIARLITDDPDIILNESDEEIRRAERRLSSHGGREALKNLRRVRERSLKGPNGRDGIVTIDHLLEVYGGRRTYYDILRPESEEDLQPGENSINMIDRWRATSTESGQRLADYLMEYAPNFKRENIHKIVQLVRELWIHLGTTQAIQEDLGLARAGVIHYSYWAQEPQVTPLTTMLEIYLEDYAEKEHQLRSRLEKLMNIYQPQAQTHTCQYPPSTDRPARLTDDDISRITRNRRTCQRCKELYNMSLD